MSTVTALPHRLLHWLSHGLLRGLLFVVMVGGLASASTRARAAAEPAGNAEAAAMALYAQGEEHYQAGRIEEALVAFQKAYQLLPAPGLLVNIGQCFRQLGDHASAVRAFERYLQEDPAADNRPEVEELIASERTLLPKPAAAPPPRKAASDDDALIASPVLWVAVGGAALALAVGGAVTIAVVAAQPQPLPVSGSLGTFDLR